METRELRYFVAVAEELHLGRAAQRLGIAQPPLSRAISQLERRLGVTLLERTSRAVALTDAGSVLLREGRAALDAVDAADRRTRRAATGQAGAAGRTSPRQPQPPADGRDRGPVRSAAAALALPGRARTRTAQGRRCATTPSCTS
jgi:DNA-binding transcriptional LysR family regulator